MTTPYRFTGQREEEALGLYYYGARWYDPELRRFIQPDTIVPQPGNPQSLNRYSYCLNNPVRYTDPSGYLSNKHIMYLFGADEWEHVLAEFREGGRLEGRWGFLIMLGKLTGPDEFVTGPVASAQLYESAREQPLNRFDDGRPRHGDRPLMTISADKVKGQLSLVEHLDDHTRRAIPVLEVGLMGDIWVGSKGQHGDFLRGQSGHVIVSLDPDRFDTAGAMLDIAGIAAAAAGPGGMVAGQVINAVSTSRSAWGLGQTIGAAESPADIGSAAGSLAVDVAGVKYQYWPDMMSLGMNVFSSLHFDVVR